MFPSASNFSTCSSLLPSPPSSSSSSSSSLLRKSTCLRFRRWSRKNEKNASRSSLFSCSSSSSSSSSPALATSSTASTEKQSSITEPFPSIGVPKRVVLVRHGQSTWNEEGRIQGSSDHSVLTSKGVSQAETSRQMLLTDSFDVCFTSPLARSKKTAEIIWASRAEQQLEVITDPDLREIDLYSFQGLLKQQGKEKFGPAYRKWQMDAPNFSVDGHYPVRELWARARTSWNRILAYQAKSVLVVAHNAVNQALVATALGLGTEYFRVLLQSNCGVSVLDFNPTTMGSSPHVCLNRLNQTPNSPLSTGSSAGRKTSKRIILVCQGVTQSNPQAIVSQFAYEPMSMLGVIQSQKTAELLLDVKLSSIICSPRVASTDTALTITEVQEAADCLGADCSPRYVEVKNKTELEVEHILAQERKIQVSNSVGHLSWFDELSDKVITDIWNQSEKAWHMLMLELSNDSELETNMVVVGHPAVHIGLIGHCLKLRREQMGCFHLDPGSISVLDFPDGSSGRGVVRCVNYTAHLGRWSVPVTRSTANDEEF